MGGIGKILNRFIIYLTAFGDTLNIGKSIELKLYDTNLGQEVGVMHAPISFATDGILRTIDDPLGVGLGNVSIKEQQLNTNQMSCFPNPFDESLTVAINANGMNSNIWLTDLTGRKVQHIYTGVLPTSGRFTIQTEELASGLYFCVAVVDGVKMTQKIVKE